MKRTTLFLVFFYLLSALLSVDVIEGASQGPTPSMSVSMTPSMSGSFSVSLTQTQSQSITLSGSGTLSGTFSGSVLPTFSSSLSFGSSISPTASVKQGVCGNSFKELTEQCDIGPNPNPEKTCCTPSCKYANGGKVCEPVPPSCFKTGRCTGFGTCRGEQPKAKGAGCNNNLGTCDGLGNCILKPPQKPISPAAKKAARKAARKRAARKARKAARRASALKKFLKKRNLKMRKKFENFNLHHLKTHGNNNDINHSKLKRLQRIDQQELDVFDNDVAEDQGLPLFSDKTN